MNFFLIEMTSLRYFMPLIIEGNKRGITSTVFIGSNKKYNSPRKYLRDIEDFSLRFGFKMQELNRQEIDGVSFFVEGVGIDYSPLSGKKIVLTALRDFAVLYSNYVDKSSYVVFLSRFFSEYHAKISDKNLYLGSPKYDLNLIRDDILKKYNLSERNKFVSVFAPNINEIKNINLKRINDIISSMGYSVIVKTRGKFPVNNKLYKGDKYVEDFSWFPPTSLELIKISDFIISFDSTTIKESIMLNTPIINFHIRGNNRRLPFLYDYDFCVNLSIKFTDAQLINSIQKIQSTNYDTVFNMAKEKHLFIDTNVSSKILEGIL